MAINRDGSAQFVIRGELVTVLQELAARHKSAVTTEIHEAINLRAFLSRKTREGNTIHLIKPATVATDVIVDWRWR